MANVRALRVVSTGLNHRTSVLIGLPLSPQAHGGESTRGNQRVAARTRVLGAVWARCHDVEFALALGVRAGEAGARDVVLGGESHSSAAGMVSALDTSLSESEAVGP